jgi:hypothetical protein
MWEFLGNGGRVGFAHFDPTNWLEHETSKKAESIRRSAYGTPYLLLRSHTHTAADYISI